jgi:hypothetical protein
LVLLWVAFILHPKQSPGVTDADLERRLIDSFLHRPSNAK